MNSKGLKREHFSNGQTFTQKTLDNYFAARSKAFKDFFTRYALCLLGGVAVGFVLSLFLGGIIKYLLPVVCVMIGALVGTKLTSASLEEYQKQSKKLCLTKKAMREAKKHLRNGTVAWSDKIEA